MPICSNLAMLLTRANSSDIISQLGFLKCAYQQSTIINTLSLFLLSKNIDNKPCNKC